MEMNILQKILRAAASAMRIPVMALLVLMLCFSVFCIGWILLEALTERRHLNYSLPRLLDLLQEHPDKIEPLIKKSGILQRQKEALIELTKHPEFNRSMLRSLGDNLIETEESHYQSILRVTSLISRIAPMLGLLGTLIPLGPGIIALGQGDSLTLSESMLTAFDTTIAGLLSAGVCLVIHTLRSSWYNRYMSDFETLADCIIEITAEEGDENE